MSSFLIAAPISFPRRCKKLPAQLPHKEQQHSHIKIVPTSHTAPNCRFQIKQIKLLTVHQSLRPQSHMFHRNQTKRDFDLTRHHPSPKRQASSRTISSFPHQPAAARRPCLASNIPGHHLLRSQLRRPTHLPCREQPNDQQSALSRSRQTLTRTTTNINPYITIRVYAQRYIDELGD
jgi:hypothetical protein